MCESAKVPRLVAFDVVVVCVVVVFRFCGQCSGGRDTCEVADIEDRVPPGLAGGQNHQGVSSQILLLQCVCLSVCLFVYLLC